MTPYNYTRRKIEFDAWRKTIIAGATPETAILGTIAFNLNTRSQQARRLRALQFMPASIKQLEYGESKLDYLGYKIDRELYGNKFHLLPRSQRTSFVACPEHLASNFHYHAVFITPDAEGFRQIANRVWQEIVPCGELFFKEDAPVTEEYIWNHAGYQLKELWSVGDSSNFYISRVGNKAAH